MSGFMESMYWTTSLIGASRQFGAQRQQSGDARKLPLHSAPRAVLRRRPG
jgi:hypothetical protein